MSKSLLMCIIVCVSISRGLANEQSETIYSLDSIQTPTKVFDYQTSYKEASEPGGRTQDTLGDTPSTRESTNYQAKQSVYRGLSSGVYSGLIEKAKMVPTQVITVEDEIKVTRPTGWQPHADCKFGEESKCLPLACKAGYCDANYAIVFSSKSCVHCPKMWPIVVQLRKEGYLVYYIETEKHPGIFEKFDLESWPTTVIMDKGQLKNRFKGVVSINKIRRQLKTKKQQGLTNDARQEKPIAIRESCQESLLLR